MSFFDSEVVRAEMTEIQELQEEVYSNVFKWTWTEFLGLDWGILWLTHDFDNEWISDITSRHQWIKQYHCSSINSWFCKNHSILTIFLFRFNFLRSASEKTETILHGFFMKFWTGPRHNVPALHLLQD